MIPWPEKKESSPELWREIAVALKLEPDSDPKVVASARGRLAERIVEVAREKGIAVVEDEDLTRSLSVIEVGSRLPEELFPAVAEIIAHVHLAASLHAKRSLGPGPQAQTGRL